jgi:hypothetical protein
MTFRLNLQACGIHSNQGKPRQTKVSLLPSPFYPAIFNRFCILHLKKNGGNMRWKQFLTPVKSLNAPETGKYLNDLSVDDYNLIDVRQPGEYKNGHIPGAKLIPVSELAERSSELDPTKPTFVY